MTYEGDKTFEAQVLVRVKAGNPPDIAIVPQPGLLKQLVATGKAVEAPKATVGQRRQVLRRRLEGLRHRRRQVLRRPARRQRQVPRLVLAEDVQGQGLEGPDHLDELMTLSDKIAASGKMKPWCAGIGSGDATGWPVTDWIEDMMLRAHGAGRLRQVGQPRHPVQRPEESTAALDAVGDVLKNDKYVNGGIGDVKSHRHDDVPGRRPADPGGQVRDAPAGELLRGQLAQGHQGRRGRRRLRVLPARPRTTSSKPVLGGGEFVARVLRPARGAGVPDLPVLGHLGERAVPRPSSAGGWVSANKGLRRRPT